MQATLQDRPDVRPAVVPRSLRARYRRAACSNERRGDIVRAMVPDGSVQAPRGSWWLFAVRSNAHVVTMNAHGRDNLIAVARALMPALQWRSMTTAPGWEYVSRQAGVSVTTVKRHLKLLRELGLLGVVATGRRAEDTPKNSGQDKNLRAVYVLCVPRSSLVERSGPPTVREFRRNPLHAREAFNPVKDENDAAPPRAEIEGAPFGRGVVRLAGSRPVEFWPGRETTIARTKAASRANELLAVREMQRRVPALRSARVAFLTFVCRRFFEAGWTVNDLLWAIDRTPSSVAVRHDGTKGINDVARWFAYRLKAWTVEGVPMRPRSRRLADESAEGRAQAIAVLLQRERRLASLPVQRDVNARGAALARAALDKARGWDRL